MIETRARLGDRFLKGYYAALLEIKNQADDAYEFAPSSALGVEANKMTALWKEKVTQNAQDVAVSKTGVSFLQLTGEGDDYKSDSRLAGYQTVFKPVKFTNSVTLTEEEKEDRLVDAKLDEARDLLIAGKMTMNKHAFDIFNYGFTAQASLPAHLTFYGDGVPFLSTVHPRKDGGTAQSNASATSIPLTETNLETARQALRRQLDDRGMPMAVGGGKLILLVPDSLEKTAAIIAKGTLRSGTANNDMNIYDGMVTVVSSKWLNSQNNGSDTAWYLVDSMFSPLRFVTRRALNVGAPYVDPNNKNITTDISARYIVGNVDWRGVWGSKGTGATYAS